MIPCPHCEAEGLKSRIREGAKQKIDGPERQFYDEDLNPHVHIMTVVVSNFFCSNGHHFDHCGIIKCPTCMAQVDPTNEDDFGRPK